MEQVLLSIIIPCYNSFGYMLKNLRYLESSVRNGIEIIIVDDCSNDKSYEQLVNYQSHSSLNVKIYQNDLNCGPGVTRNNGLKKATGKYVAFLDADDYFSENYFDVIIPILQKNVDCVIHDHIIKHSTGLEYSCSGFFIKMKAEEISKEKAIVFVRGCPWGKVYRKSCIVQNNVEFLNQKQNEDLPFTKCAVASCNSIVYVQKPLYYYLQLPTSLMHNNKLLSATNAQNSFIYIKDKIGSLFPDEVEGVYILGYLYTSVITNINFMKRREWKQYVADTENIYPNYMKSKYYKMYSRKKKTVVKLIHYKQYDLLRLLAWTKKFKIYN